MYSLKGKGGFFILKNKKTGKTIKTGSFHDCYKAILDAENSKQIDNSERRVKD
ncbi:hypothetical protein [Treponema pedis]|uniref:hypothetical protein n=1 Tax=Treponema pedis TaxID=409322 RepID=UPI0003F53B43|nr:hypothetical protein [Treponema pedis]